MALAVVIGAHAQTVVSSDNYNYTTGATGQNSDLSSDASTRESGALAPISYVDRSAAINGANQQYLSQDEAYNHGVDPANGVLVQRALVGSTGGGAIASNSVVLDNDLSGSVSGQLWTTSFTDVLRPIFLDPNSTPIQAWYSAFCLGRSNAGGEPNFAAIDFALQVNYDGSYKVFANQTMAGSGTLAGFALDSPFEVSISLDETGITPMALVSIDTGSGLASLGAFSFNYNSAGTGRYLDFVNRLFVSSTPPSGGFSAYVDTQIDNLFVTVAVPEPSCLCLLSTFLPCLVQRRRKAAA